MNNLLIICIMFLNFTCTSGQDEYIKTYKFGYFTVETGYCKNAASIEITEKRKTVFYNCSGDGAGYYDVDTLSINADKWLDFIYCYKMEDYTSVSLLVSNLDTPRYKSVGIIDVSSPDIYGNFTPAKGEKLMDYILKDINKDGSRDLITNVVERDGEYYPIKNLTDTILYSELKARSEGIIKGVRSRGIFLDPKNAEH